MKTRHFGTLAASASIVLGACTLQPAYVDPIARAKATMTVARDAGGAQVAPAEYGLAADKLALTGRFIAVRDDKPARWLAEQAEVDAELARMKAMSARAMAEAARQTEALRAHLRVSTEGGAR